MRLAYTSLKSAVMILYNQLEKEIITMLTDKLPSALHYHSVSHTKDVIAAAECISRAEGLTEEELNLVRTAALFHDSGFVLGYNNHEKNSCIIAKEVLKKNNYPDAFIEQVCKMIMATKIPQSPKDKLSEILCDADLDYLGREDFFKISNKLYSERSAMVTAESTDKWNQMQVKFFKSHHYFTPTSIKLRAELKQKHLDILIASLAA